MGCREIKNLERTLVEIDPNKITFPSQLHLYLDNDGQSYSVTLSDSKIFPDNGAICTDKDTAKKFYDRAIEALESGDYELTYTPSGYLKFKFT